MKTVEEDKKRGQEQPVPVRRSRSAGLREGAIQMQLGVYDKDVDVFLRQIDRRSSYYAEQGQVPEWFSDIMLIHKEIYLTRPAR